MDMQGNIYDLAGNFIGTTDGDGGLGGDGSAQQIGGDSELIMDGDGEEQYIEGDDYWVSSYKLSNVRKFKYFHSLA